MVSFLLPGLVLLSSVVCVSPLVCSLIFLCGICSALLFGVCVFFLFLGVLWCCWWRGFLWGAMLGLCFLVVVWFLGCFGSFFVACFGVPCFLGGVGWGVFGVVRGSVGVLVGFCGWWVGCVVLGFGLLCGACVGFGGVVVFFGVGCVVVGYDVVFFDFLLVAGLLVLVVWCICFCVGGCVWFRVWMVFRW